MLSFVFFFFPIHTHSVLLHIWMEKTKEIYFFFLVHFTFYDRWMQQLKPNWRETHNVEWNVGVPFTSEMDSYCACTLTSTLCVCVRGTHFGQAHTHTMIVIILQNNILDTINKLKSAAQFFFFLYTLYFCINVCKSLYWQTLLRFVTCKGCVCVSRTGTQL